MPRILQDLFLYAKVSRTTMGNCNSELLCNMVSDYLFYLAWSVSIAQTQCAVKFEVTRCHAKLELSDLTEILLRALSSVFTCPYLRLSKQDTEPKHLLVYMLVGQPSSLKLFMKPGSYLDIFVLLPSANEVKLKVKLSAVVYQNWMLKKNHNVVYEAK